MKLNLNEQKLLLKSSILLFILFSITGCSDIIDGTAHMAYGFASFMLGLLKLGFVILVAIVVIAVIVNIYKSLFGNK